MLIIALFAFYVRGAVAEEVALPWDELSFESSDLAAPAFKQLMQEVYAPFGGWESFIEVEREGVRIVKGEDGKTIFVPFSVGPTKSRPVLELDGMRIVLDPGHIGGEWAELEERSFSIEGRGPVKEGELVLATALRMKSRLESLGADVFLTRENSKPVTSSRLDDFLVEATGILIERDDVSVADFEEESLALAARLFYRTAEIKARADLVNNEIKPDLAIALHINAVSWEDPDNPALSDVDNGHILVNGGYLPSELDELDHRFYLLNRLSKGYHDVEIPLAETIAEVMVEYTGLEPYKYGGNNAKLVQGSEYVWARNLLANRLFDCPVVFMEPWIANSKQVFEWALLGDYDGTKLVNGVEKESLPVSYSNFVVEGLVRYCEGR
ncbi:N-acetylmuramoyl-L-alanine amidase [Puniceicoccaceae bacterium K14]|nr:N-acetylmuramoyl-L-alanine amidase [Puniceicoccaceae bacterium K14]